MRAGMVSATLVHINSQGCTSPKFLLNTENQDSMSVSTTPVDVSDEQVTILKDILLGHFAKTEVELANQTQRINEVPDSKVPGYSSVYRNAAVPIEGEISAYIDPAFDNYYTFLEACFKLFGNKRALGERKFNNTVPNGWDEFYTYETYDEVRAHKDNLGAGIIQVVTNHKFYESKILANLPTFEGLNNDKPHRWVVSLLSSNRREWVLTDFACQSYSLCNTALYDTLGADTTAYILDLTKSPVVVCSRDQILRLIQLKKQFPDKLSTLLVIVSMDRLDIQQDYPLFSLAGNVDINLYDFEQVENLGANFPIAKTPVGRDDIYTISFTSGTTGMPKGVVVPQRMILAGLTFCFMNFYADSTNVFETEIRYLTFLPLTHIYERQSFAFTFIRGIVVGFPSSNVPAESLLSDLKTIKPHAFIAVPRVFTKFEASLKEAISQPGLKAWLVRKVTENREAVQSSEDHARGDLLLYDKIITSKLRSALGFDNVVYTVTGSAPISPETVKFLKAILNVGVRQGYGLTESFAGVTISLPYEANPGSSGPIGNTIEICLRDLPSMNYTHDDPDGVPKGELMLRGPQVFDNYYLRPKETEESFNKDGWFHTGDVAKIEKDGKLSIVDRVKNFFKLSQGEYITPERIENVYLSSCPMITQIFVHGDSTQSYLIAIVGFEPQLLKNFVNKGKLPANIKAKINGLEGDALFKEVNSNSFIKQYLVKGLNSLACIEKNGVNTLHGFEKIHNLEADFMPLKVEDNTVTPTMKLKRNIAAKHFRKVLDKLYAEGSLIKGAKV